jgi:glycosyltransferase involved in cell wall biosynthesis
MQPRISVIVPVYKAEKYLHRCIDSILAQTFTDFELLLINDGSPDNSGAICDEYVQKDSRVRVFHKENGGVSSARNSGLNNAKGKYVTFIDADDYVDKEWLDTYNEGIRRNADLVVQGFYRVTGDQVNKNVISSFFGDTVDDIQEIVKRMVTSSSFGYVWITAFRRNLIEECSIRFDENSSFTEDAQFLALFIEHASSVQMINKANYYYFAPEETKKYNGDKYYSVLRVCNSFKNIFKGHIPKEFCKKYFSYIKNGAIEYITQKKDLDDFHISLYKEMVNTLEMTSGMKNKIRNFLILNSPYTKFISRCVLSLMKKISK